MLTKHNLFVFVDVMHSVIFLLLYSIIIPLSFLDEVSHLRHSLTYNLDDKQDIIRAVKHMNQKANSVLCKFSAVDPSFDRCIVYIGTVHNS